MSLSNIVNFHKVTSKISSSGQPTIKQFKAIANAGFKQIINLAMPDHPDALPDEAALVAKLGMHYHTIPIPFNAPRRQHYQALSALLNRFADDKIWLHCILNYRVSALLFHYLQTHAGLSAAAANAAVFTHWQADNNWQLVWQWPSTERQALQIRRFQPADLPGLLMLFERTLHQTTDTDASLAGQHIRAVERSGFANWTNRLHEEQVFICQTSQQLLAGVIAINQNGLIEQLLTDPVMQGWGVASSLLKQAENWARQQNMRFLLAETSLVTKGFFEKHGFLMMGNQQVEHDGETLVIYRLQRGLDRPVS